MGARGELIAHAAPALRVEVLLSRRRRLNVLSVTAHRRGSRGLP
jgi:hypothetical protein